jgi:hypothetical protein
VIRGLENTEQRGETTSIGQDILSDPHIVTSLSLTDKVAPPHRHHPPLLRNITKEQQSSTRIKSLIAKTNAIIYQIKKKNLPPLFLPWHLPHKIFPYSYLTLKHVFTVD